MSQVRSGSIQVEELRVEPCGTTFERQTFPETCNPSNWVPDNPVNRADLGTLSGADGPGRWWPSRLAAGSRAPIGF